MKYKKTIQIAYNLIIDSTLFLSEEEKSKIPYYDFFDRSWNIQLDYPGAKERVLRIIAKNEEGLIVCFKYLVENDYIEVLGTKKLLTYWLGCRGDFSNFKEKVSNINTLEELHYFFIPSHEDMVELSKLKELE